MSLAALLHPMSVEEFFRDYVGRKSLHLKGTPDKVKKVFGVDMSVDWVVEKVKEDQARARKRLSAITYVADMDSDGFSIRGPKETRVQLDHQAVINLLTDGLGPLVVSLRDIANCDPVLLHRYLTVRRDFGCDGVQTSHLFFRPKCSVDAPGRGLHWGYNDGLFLQIAGKRRFVLGKESAYLEPYCHANYFEGVGVVERASDETVDVNEADVLDVDPQQLTADRFYAADLEPGDFLYIPPACLHQTHYVAGDYSMGFNFTLRSKTAEELLRSVLESNAEEDRDLWGVPYRTLSRDPDKNRLRASIDNVIERLIQLRDNDEELDRTLAQEQSYENLPLYQFPSEADGELKPDSLLRHALGYVFTGHMGKNEEGEPTFRLFAGESREVEFEDPRLFSFAERLVAHRDFRLSECRGWASNELSDDEVVEFVQSLLEAGLLERAQAV